MPIASCAAAIAFTASTGFRFCGIADEPPFPGRALRDLGDLRLREQHDVTRDLRDDARRHA